MLDLGAVAKGLAVDMAARELQPLADFAIDAGGDLYLGGRDPGGEPWSVGIRHPRAGRPADRRRPRVRCGRVHVRRLRAPARTRAGHHILDPRSGALRRRGRQRDGRRADRDAGGRAGDGGVRARAPPTGLRLLERHGVEGLIVSAGTGAACNARLRRERSAVRRFFATPKGLLTIVLLLLAALAALTKASGSSRPDCWRDCRRGAGRRADPAAADQARWEFPSGAVLTALLVAMVLSPQSLVRPPATSAVAVVSKYLVRTRRPTSSIRRRSRWS